jgi:formylglycine-generating enzyme required for sulfatase activity
MAANDDVDFGRMDDDAGLDPIRDDPEFAQIRKIGRPERRYTAAWTSAAGFEAMPIYGPDAAAQKEKARELIGEGYRPVSWSAAGTTPEGPLVTASLWHRPLVKEEDKDRLADRQGRAAVALLRLGRAEEVWPLLHHSADPRLRSFIINWLSPLGAAPELLSAALDGIQPIAKPAPAPGQQPMDAIVFHPENSVRRALILALGSDTMTRSSVGEREPLFGKLLDLYRNDPDAGIHGAAEWALRKWGQHAQLKEADEELMRLKDWAGRRWYLNGQGETFAVIDGPVEFRMGSPPNEPERDTGAPMRRVVIPRRFAIATKELTVEQFQRFLKQTEPGIGRERLSPRHLSKFSPDPDGPWIGLTWYKAAHYCNWLSEKEGLPKEEWCYLPNEAGAYNDGMSMPSNDLERKGYRLPTEAEWEYACRAGAVTSRHYGNSTDLLDNYAWWRANSREHAWSCGSLLPNDLGLFDFLGNVFEWCQDRNDTPRNPRKGLYVDTIDQRPYLSDRNGRLIRGGAFTGQTHFARSAQRNALSPSFLNFDLGFRVARTCP